MACLPDCGRIEKGEAPKSKHTKNRLLKERFHIKEFRHPADYPSQNPGTVSSQRGSI